MDGLRDSNPNAAGSEGLRGDMGVSSERTGPLGDSDPDNEGIEGTGSVGSSADRTDGTVDTSPAPVEDDPGIDRTVGEENSAEVPSHENDPGKNPGHSHG